MVLADHPLEMLEGVDAATEPQIDYELLFHELAGRNTQLMMENMRLAEELGTSKKRVTALLKRIQELEVLV